MAHKRIRRAVVVVLLLCLVAVVVMVCILPMVACLEPVRRAVLAQVNRRIPGTLEIDDWSLGWFSGIEVDGIRFAGEPPVRRVAVESVSVEAGLLTFLGKSRDLGRIRIVRPRVDLILSDPGRVGSKASSISVTSPGRKLPTHADPVSVPNLKCRIEISEGSLSIKYEGTNAPFEEEVIGFSGAADIDTVAGSVQLDSLMVTSAPVVLSCAGELADGHGNRDVLAEGELTVDLDWFADVVLAMTGEKIVASGRRAGPFVIRTSLKATTFKEILEATVASASLYVERLEFFGIALGENTVLSTFSNGVATVSIDAPVNDGRLVLVPVVDLRGDAAVLTHQENSRVLAKVKPTEEMVDKLLSRIHPVFKGCVFTAGTMTLVLNKLHVTGKNPVEHSVIKGRVFLSGVKLNAKGMLNDVLELAGIRERSITVGEQEFGFEYREGRMFPEPTTIRADGYTFVFSGSVGTDQTLDYAVKIPIVPSMRSFLGRDGYQLLKGQTFDIPITGTTTRPRLDSKAFQSMLKELAKKGVSRLLEREAGKFLEGLLR